LTQDGSSWIRIVVKSIVADEFCDKDPRLVFVFGEFVGNQSQHKFLFGFVVSVVNDFCKLVEAFLAIVNPVVVGR
jgi:hypothetical protein